MKRSQAIKKIEEIYRDHTGLLPSESFAEEILNALQEQGMKPPVKKRCPVLLTDTHVWEKENAES